MPEISEIVNVTISVQSSALSRKGFNSLMIVGAPADFGGGFAEHEVRKYSSFSAVGDDTDILDGDLKDALQVAFAQSPSVPDVYVSKVDASDVPQIGTLVFDAPLVTSNSIAVTIDGTPIAGSPIAFNTDNATTLSDIATALQAEAKVATAVSDGTDTITITGATDGDSFAVAAVVTGGASQATATHTVTQVAQIGLVASDLDSIAANNNEWFGYAHVFSDDASAQNASSWAAANKKYAFFLITDKTKDLALASNYSSIWYTDATYTGTAKWLQVAIASRILALTPGSYTAAFKSLELVTATQLTGTEEGVLRTNNVNQYSEVAGRDITWDGVNSAGGFVDLYIGVLYLEARIEEDVFATIAAREKVPFTNDGINLVAGAIQGRLNQSVDEGFLTNDPSPSVDAPLASDVSAVDKSNRLLSPIAFTAYTAGAIHTVQINGVVVA